MALEYDGIGSWVSIALQSYVSRFGTFSFLGWLNPSDTTAGTIFQNATVGTDRVGLRTVSSSARFGYWDGGTYTSKSGTLNSNEWSHVAAICDAGTLYLYINGDLQVGTSDPFVHNDPSYLYIGKTSNDANYFTGAMAEISLWNRVLTQDEVRCHMYRKLTGAENGLVGYWPMNDAGVGTSVTIKDQCQEPHKVLLHGCEVANWTEINAALAATLNSTNFVQGANSLNLGKDGSNVAASYDYDIAAFDGTGRSLYAWLYIDDAATLNKLATAAAIDIRVGQENTNAVYKRYTRGELVVGLQKIGGPISTFLDIGSPDTTAIDWMRLLIKTTNAGDTIALGKLWMDNWYIEDTPPVAFDGTMNDFAGNPWREGPPIILGRAA